MVAILVAQHVDFIFLEPSLIGDVHIVLGYELMLLYEGRLHSTEDDPIGY